MIAAMGIDKAEACKGCSSSVQVSEAQLIRLLGKIKAEDAVADDAYRERLAACGNCESLAYGTTCMHCGCLVRLRAKLKAGRCPHPSPAVRERWQAAVKEHA